MNLYRYIILLTPLQVCRVLNPQIEQAKSRKYRGMFEVRSPEIY